MNSILNLLKIRNDKTNDCKKVYKVSRMMSKEKDVGNFTTFLINNLKGTEDLSNYDFCVSVNKERDKDLWLIEGILYHKA